MVRSAATGTWDPSASAGEAANTGLKTPFWNESLLCVFLYNPAAVKSLGAATPSKRSVAGVMLQSECLIHRDAVSTWRRGRGQEEGKEEEEEKAGDGVNKKSPRQPLDSDTKTVRETSD